MSKQVSQHSTTTLQDEISIEDAPFAMLVFTQSGTVIESNEKTASVLGFSSHELEGQNLSNLFLDTQNTKPIEIESLLNYQAEISGGILCYACHKQGSIIPVAFSVHSQTKDDKYIAGIIGLPGLNQSYVAFRTVLIAPPVAC